MERKNIFFIVWLVIVFTSVILVIFAFSKTQSENVTPPPTQAPAPTVEITKAPTVEFTAEIPRPAQNSLNMNLAHTQILGGGGSDVLKGVITLDTYYLFGTTNSAEGDFECGGDTDIFLAKMGMSGELIATHTVKSDGEDILINAKPYSKTAEGGKSGIVFVSQKEGEEDKLVITKISSDLESEFKTEIDFDGEVTPKTVLHTQNALILHVNVEDGDDIYSEILQISYDLTNVDRQKVTLSSEFKIVNGYAMGDTQIMLVNIFEENKNSIAVLEFNTKTEEKTLNRFAGDYENGINMTPKSNGGFLIEYTYHQDNTKKFGILAVSKDYSVEFSHTISGGDFESVQVVEDHKNNNHTGYYIFATKKVNGSYETFSEYICTHGDLIYVDTAFLKNVLPKHFHVSEEGMAVVGEVITDSQTDITMVSADNNGKVLRSEIYGGESEEAYVFSIINRYGNLDIFASTTSETKDIPHAFGKADVIMMEISS